MVSRDTMVDPYDLDEVAEVVVRLPEDETLADPIGANARERVREQTLVARRVLEYLDLLFSL